MKTSRTNSFRLHRISRATSLKKQSQTFYLPDQTVKLSAINSVTRGVKHSQLSFITGDDLNKLRVQPIISNDNFYDSAHQSLTDVRRKYDQIKKQRVNADQNIVRLKAQIKKYQTIQQEYQDKKGQGQSSVSGMQKSLADIKILLEETVMQKKVLLCIQRRLKYDKVVYDQRKYDFQQQYRFQNKQIQLFRKDGFYAGQENDRTVKIYQRFLSQLNAENKERQEHLRNLQSMVQEKQRSNLHNTTRGKQIYQIAERALQDKDPTQKQWHQIYLTNVFVSRLLRNKIDRQMEKFSVVEFAFKNIKTATGVHDAKTLVKKFLNKEAEYGDLLGRITINQKKISELKQVRDFLLEEQKQLQMEKQTLANSKAHSIDISNQLKSFSQVSESQRKMETHLSKMSTWIHKQAKKLNAIEKSSLSFQESRKKQTVKQNFIEFCQIVANLLAKCDKQKEGSQAATTTPSDISARDSARVARIAPKKSRKNSVGQQIFDVDEQELAPSNQHEQKQMVNTQRDELMRTNEKFMKQARKRMEEKRKANLQKVVEKKDKKVVQVKKEED